MAANKPPRGKPFEAGQSGNPKGRPPVKREIKELAREHTDTALKTLVDIAKAGRTDAARVTAAIALLDRGHGKPTQAVEVSGKLSFEDALQSLTGE